ncbi:hypothetical protein BpHYR1_028437 [Brachionus plicatilis]|uniref:HAT C-terminal dimerisation domain-containing protein n=1 Tax=Brachionus plicatilis TaxID=10195 RepID=A0A3M7R318_BRAPC|nr:hypothetical protein BpHYR1_028437 [Brachionus plicatilis]
MVLQVRFQSIYSSIDFKFEFKYYELLNNNFSETNTIYKLHFKKEISILSKVCELNYCVTATSVSSENLFSNAGLVQNDQRNRMESSALNMLKNALTNIY